MADDTRETTNHGWTIPRVGRANDEWGQILNDFFDNELDAQVILEGPHSERPTAGSDVVKYYHSTDRDVIYYNDGSSWNEIAGFGNVDDPVTALFVSSLDVTSFERLRNASEPGTPANGDIAIWNNGNSLNAKFDDGSTVTIAEQ